MTQKYSEAEVIAAVTRLTKPQLKTFVELEIVTPIHSDAGLLFRRVDLARIELLCELSEDFELDEDALGVVISLIDQLHNARTDLRALVGAIEVEPIDVRTRIIAALRSGH